MFPDEDAYADLDWIDPNDTAMVGYWAKRWNVSAEDILAAIARVGPLIKYVAPGIWKLT